MIHKVELTAEAKILCEDVWIGDNDCHLATVMRGTLVSRGCQGMSSKQASRQTLAHVLEGVHRIGGHGSHWVVACQKQGTPSKQSAKIPSAIHQ